MSQTIIDVNDLKAYYNIRTGGNTTVSVKAVDNVSFQINKGEIIGIIGESGCGKSTLTKTIYGSIYSPLTVVGGSVVYNIDSKKIDILKLGRSALNRIWWEIISYIPQGSMSILNPTIRIRDQFLDVINAHDKSIGKKEAKEMILKHIDRVGLPSEVATSFPHQLSGGMKQRVVIALATILGSKILLADEPTTALDVVVQRGILQLLSKIREELKCTILVITHDMGVHAQICDRVAIMYAGKMVEIGPVGEIYKEPLHPYTRFLIQSLPKIGDKSRKISVSGRPPSLQDPPRGCRFHPRCAFAKDICKNFDPNIVLINPHHWAACHLLEAK